MGFTCDPENNNIFKFTFTKDFNKEDFKKFLGILSRFLDLKRPFGFYIDASLAHMAPLNTSVNLINWMKKNKPRIKSEGNLIASAVVFKSKTLTSMLSAAFKIQTPISPNLITTDITRASKFVRDLMDIYVMNNVSLVSIDVKDTIKDDESLSEGDHDPEEAVDPKV